MILEGTVRYLVDLGLMDVILPFLLVFALVYGMLQRSKALGTEHDGSPRRNLNSLVAFVMGFLVVASLQVVEALTRIAQYSAVAILGVVMLYTIGTMLDVKLKGKGLKESWWPKLFVAFLVAGIAIAALGAWDYFDFAWVVAFTPALLFIAIVGLIIWVVMHEKPKTPAPGELPPQEIAPPSSEV